MQQLQNTPTIPMSISTNNNMKWTSIYESDLQYQYSDAEEDSIELKEHFKDSTDNEYINDE